MRWLAAFVTAFLAVCLANQAALAGKRVALVIGNSSYQNVAALTNPANDATAVTEMFKKASFDVVESRRDLKYMEMRRALRDFADKARGADIAVIYFAGHGLEVDGTNYVVPVDAVLERDADVDDEAIALNRILLAAEPATQLRLVILDACRDNPFTKKMKRTISSRSLGRGLIGVEANKPNTFIAFAAKEGSTAADGDGKNSPFSAALLKHLTRPGLDIRKAFGFVRDDVMSATGNQQEPYTTNSLGGNDVALVPAPASPLATGGNKGSLGFVCGGKPVRLLHGSGQGAAQQARRRNGADRCDRKSPQCRGGAGKTGRRGRQGQRAGQGCGAIEGRRRGEAGSGEEKADRRRKTEGSGAGKGRRTRKTGD
jgi:hypothetical protein